MRLVNVDDKVVNVNYRFTGVGKVCNVLWTGLMSGTREYVNANRNSVFRVKVGNLAIGLCLVNGGQGGQDQGAGACLNFIYLSRNRRVSLSVSRVACAGLSINYFTHAMGMV